MIKKIREIKRLLYLLLKKRVTAVDRLEELDGKVIMITGAGKGLGLSIGKHLLKEKSKVVFASRDIEQLNEELKGYSVNDYLLISGDVTNYSDMENAVNKTIHKFRQIDVLINNAGVSIFEPFANARESVDLVIDTNIKGVINSTQAVLSSMINKKQGLIINIGSKISHNTNVQPNKVLYATSKYAVEGFSYALNRELKKDNIRVVCLMPGTINTFLSIKSADYMSPDRVAQFIAMIIKFKDIDFEGIVFKSVEQDI